MTRLSALSPEFARKVSQLPGEDFEAVAEAAEPAQLSAQLLAAKVSFNAEGEVELHACFGRRPLQPRALWGLFDKASRFRRRADSNCESVVEGAWKVAYAVRDIAAREELFLPYAEASLRPPSVSKAMLRSQSRCRPPEATPHKHFERLSLQRTTADLRSARLSLPRAP